MRNTSVAAVLLLSASFAGAAPPGAAPPDGKALFAAKCLMCHGKGGMGTGLLSRRVQPPELLLRDNLVAAFVRQAARVGLGNMPAITRGEVGDVQLEVIAQFLEDNSRLHR